MRILHELAAGIGKGARLLLGLAAALIVVWAFVDVGARIWDRQRSQAEVELTVVHWGDNEEIQIIQAMLEEFGRLHPEIRIHRVHAPDYWPKVKTMFASGDPPDLFYFEPQFTPELVDLGLVMPIDDLIAEAGGHEEVLGDYYQVVVDAFRYDGQRVGKGPLYGIPKDFTTSIMYVNLDLFEQAGIPVPYDGWTWEEYEEAMRRITALSTPRRKVWGGMLQLWPPSLLNVIWSFGGDYFALDEEGAADFRNVTLDTPEALAALEMIQRLRLRERTLYNPGGIAEEADNIFVRGDMGTLGPIGRWRTPLFRRAAEENNLRFDVVPVPHAAGQAPASQIYTVAYAISASTRHPEEAFLLQRFLTGPQGAEIASRMGLAIPPMRSVAESDAFIDPDIPPANDRIFLDTIEVARIQQFPLYYSQFDQIVSSAQQGALELGSLTPDEAAQRIETQWLQVLDSPLRDDHPRMNWLAIGSLAAVVLAVATTLLWLRSKRQKLGSLDRAQERAGFAFIAPWLIGFAILTAFPMIMSLLLAFSSWTAMTPLTRAEFVGLANFRVLFSDDSSFTRSLWVTGYYVLLGVPLTQVLALGVALLMNAQARGIGVFRTIYFLPSVISGVALATLWLKLFNRDYGLINAILASPATSGLLAMLLVLGIWMAVAIPALRRPRKAAGGAQRPWPLILLAGSLVLAPVAAWVAISAGLRLPAPDWFGSDARRWAIPGFVLMSLWGVGGGMVIYLAGLKNIPATLYEAATIDGAGPLRRMWNVTIPMLSPLIFFNVVMGLIASFQIFTQAKVMTDGGPDEATLFYVLNLYRSAFEFHQMGYASAMAWVLFVIILVITIMIFAASRRLVHYEGLKG